MTALSRSSLELFASGNISFRWSGYFGINSILFLQLLYGNEFCQSPPAPSPRLQPACAFILRGNLLKITCLSLGWLLRAFILYALIQMLTYFISELTNPAHSVFHSFPHFKCKCSSLPLTDTAVCLLAISVEDTIYLLKTPSRSTSYTMWNISIFPFLFFLCLLPYSANSTTYFIIYGSNTYSSSFEHSYNDSGHFKPPHYLLSSLLVEAFPPHKPPPTSKSFECVLPAEVRVTLWACTGGYHWSMATHQCLHPWRQQATEFEGIT